MAARWLLNFGACLPRAPPAGHDGGECAGCSALEQSPICFRPLNALYHPILSFTQGMTEEDVQAAAHAAAEDAAMSNDLRRSAGGGMDAQKRYYALAHRWGAYRLISDGCCVYWRRAHGRSVVLLCPGVQVGLIACYCCVC